MFGYDEDDLHTIDETVKFAIRNKLFFAAFNHLVPFPGTPLYERLKNEGRLLYPEWWLDPNYKFGDVVFLPKKMSPEELSVWCLKARKRFYSYSSIFRRMFDSKILNPVILSAFLWYNILSRKDVTSRQGLPLGLEKGSADE